MNMYPQPDEPDETSADTPSQANSEDSDESKMEGESALLPKTILGGKEFQPGEEVVLKIVAMHGDEVEVQYAPEKSSEDESGEDDTDTEGGGEMAGAMNKLSSMGGKGGGY